MGLVGENGAGKSTTIKAVLDLIQKDSGKVTFWGQELSSSKLLKEDIGVVFDGINFYETLTPEQTGKILAAAYRQWDSRLYSDYLSRFQLPERKEIKTFFKGMKTKLCIATALSHHPKLLILDEATSGLDPVMRDEILMYSGACRKNGCQWDVLVADKEKARHKYKDAVIDDAAIDDILLLYVKGEQQK